MAADSCATFPLAKAWNQYARPRDHDSETMRRTPDAVTDCHSGGRFGLVPGFHEAPADQLSSGAGHVASHADQSVGAPTLLTSCHCFE